MHEWAAKGGLGPPSPELIVTSRQEQRAQNWSSDINSLPKCSTPGGALYGCIQCPPQLAPVHIPAKPFGTRLKTEPRGSALCWKSESLGCCYDGHRVSRARYLKTQAGFTCGDILGAEIIGQNIENVLHLNLRKIYHKTKF